MKEIPVTVIVPVRNEAANLSTCLKSLAGIAEIVVVDSGSTDGTVEIARSHGAHVVQFVWDGKYPKKRNWTLQNWHFRTEWVLFLDADECLTEPFKREMALAIRHDGTVGCWLRYRNHFMGRPLRHGVPQRKLALFRVGAGAYERIEKENWSGLDVEVHEHPILAGSVSEIREPIEHADFRGLQHFVERHNAYATWEARRFLALRSGVAVNGAMTARQKGKYRYLHRAWFAPAYFVLTYFFRFGILDGSAGLHYAILKAIYFYQVRLKIQELA